ncbi:M20/M25/M40 family metallo-hydrolase [Thermoflexus sp.]|uniref:M20 family metallopeptidase n=3 Tax=Thermoflexus sp. TaxID=1969742 RepID=UPI0025D6398F|nr:M20/M25/M40 family metallo-hydrolase [Thermoflexus sp.]MDW8180973.1 M20/M25/M40 family metallo-hydrolase [Anaerolineae bacterium]MCS6963260.1 M20/M25/M40 family metallo-hydrolase [Thermoflexus sp.]MCS7351515.1 M20/M25/M40 family metallo-hydrolase [Thermoflexus sp.]MCX7690625.1 M20/M25/M40 family metallo-hydrolase [Thermoflexus sp.]MDW8183995.1 M20/M25/M40 family metallo-hydrolase [Anaerolineae bacterium]
MENLKDFLRATLVQLIEIPSPNGEEGSLIAFLEDWLQVRGFPAARFPVPGYPWPNLLVHPQPRPQLLITAHVDTVPPLAHPQPYVAVEQEDRIYGLGSVDVKGGLAALMVALDVIGPDRLMRSPVSIALTVDEENMGRGAEALARACRPEAVLAIEPTDLSIGIAEAGTMELALEIRGRSAHGSVVERGRNAIQGAMELLRELESLPSIRAQHPLIGRGAVTPLFIRGGERALVIPDRCELHLDIRWLPGIPRETFVGEIEATLTRHAAVWQVIDLSAPFETPAEAPLVQTLATILTEAGLPVRLSGMPSWTDAEPFARYGAQAVVFGPGTLALAHTPEEHISISELLHATRALIALIQKVVA